MVSLQVQIRFRLLDRMHKMAGIQKKNRAEDFIKRCGRDQINVAIESCICTVEVKGDAKGVVIHRVNGE